jgi:polyphosphate:AMP phosphotransferase
MLEAAELGRKISKAEYREHVPKLREELIELQLRLRDARFTVVVMIDGDDRWGCNEVLNLLHEWLDPRHLEANAFDEPTDEERERPLFWRYWRALPSHGRIGTFLRGWTMQAIVDRLRERLDEDGLDRMIRRIGSFEAALVADGALLIKFWLHLPPAERERRLKASRKDRDKLWGISKADWKIHENYEHARPIAEKVLRGTDRAEAPWHIVESTDREYRNLKVAETLRGILGRRLDTALQGSAAGKPAAPSRTPRDPVTLLDQVDLSREMPREGYERALARWQARLHRGARQAKDAGVSSVLVFEGWDAAGKGGVIRRLTAAMDAPLYRVVRIGAPTPEESAYHYLWRFWRRLPRAGRMQIFDRSWYGRVLVERVEGFASEGEWRRAYSEINDFEEQLCEHAVVLLKFWLHIDPDEQLRRFRAREETPFKRHKITEEDYRNRARRQDYELSAGEMIECTSSEYAPWHLVAANDKRWARIEVLKTVCRALEKAL